MIYQVEAPDGRIISVEGPEGASDEDIIKFAQSQYRAETKISPEVQAERDKGRAAIILQELGKATDPEDKAALRRELARMGIKVPEAAADAARAKIAEFERQALSPDIDPAQAAQLGASGIAAAGGYKASPIIKKGLEAVSEASQRPAFAQPGTTPRAPAAPAGGLIPTDPQNVRIQSGTTVDDTTGRARQTGYTERTAQEAARRQEMARIQQELIARRLIPPGNPMAQMPGMTSTPGGVMVPSGAVYPTTPSAPPPPKVSPLTQVSETFRTIGRTGANLFADIMRSRAMGALGAGSAAYQGLEALKHLKAGRDEEAALSGAGALGGALMMIPTLPTTMVGGALSAAPYLYRKAQQATPQQVNRMQTSVDAMGNPI